jgi:alkylhydroperoxidase family enzyme
LQGEEYAEVAKALRDGDLARAPITPAERLLLEFVGTLTRHAYRITDEQVQGLRDAGWTDEQIAEAVYDGALFNLLVRLADAFDIHPPEMMDPDGVPKAVKTEV